MVCLSGTRVESRIVSPGHTKSGKVVKQSPVATLTQRRTTPFDVSFMAVGMNLRVFGESRTVADEHGAIHGANFSYNP